MRTIELLTSTRTDVYIERISPTPLLTVVAGGDHLAPTHLAEVAWLWDVCS